VKKQKQGFTLIELVVVMAIIAVLAVLIIGAIILARRTATETANRGNARTMQVAMEAYYAKNRSYPSFSAANFDSASNSPLWASGSMTPPIMANSACTGTFSMGGQINSSSSAYTIDVSDYSCSATMSKDQIHVP
jgi:prepilin-type N-terminal cleavage/methylation domain-containing protein